MYPVTGVYTVKMLPIKPIIECNELQFTTHSFQYRLSDSYLCPSHHTEILLGKILRAKLCHVYLTCLSNLIVIKLSWQQNIIHFLSFLIGCLLFYLRRHADLWEKANILIHYTQQIASAMKYLESKKFIHRDLVSILCLFMR